MTTKVKLLSGGQRQALTLLMATLQRPKLLLLDEHTAALDPKTAHKVLELSDQIISEDKLTTLMVTHNMRDAIRHGNRLVMMSESRVALDIEGEEKEKLTVEVLFLSVFSVRQRQRCGGRQVGAVEKKGFYEAVELIFRRLFYIYWNQTYIMK